jgi:gliding motility-associated protein GldC
MGKKFGCALEQYQKDYWSIVLDLHSIMTDSNINIKVQLDADKVPQQISWNASETSADEPQKAKAMCLAFWDGIEKSAMRIDLWTKDMMVDEMAYFYYLIFVTMADTFERETKHTELAHDLRKFALNFQKKFIEIEEAKK